MKWPIKSELGIRDISYIRVKSYVIASKPIKYINIEQRVVQNISWIFMVWPIKSELGVRDISYQNEVLFIATKPIIYINVVQYYIRLLSKKPVYNESCSNSIKSLPENEVIPTTLPLLSILTFTIIILPNYTVCNNDSLTDSTSSSDVSFYIRALPLLPCTIIL